MSLDDSDIDLKLIYNDLKVSMDASKDHILNHSKCLGFLQLHIVQYLKTRVGRAWASRKALFVTKGAPNLKKILHRVEKICNLSTYAALTAKTKITPCHHPLSIYILNVTSIVKLHAIEHLKCDVYHLHPDIIIIITKSWLRPDHPDGLIAINGYTPFRKAGGIVTYLKTSISSQIHIISPHAINDAPEILCLKYIIDSEPYFICAIYHPPIHLLYEVYTLYSGFPLTKVTTLTKYGINYRNRSGLIVLRLGQNTVAKLDEFFLTKFFN
ncbi:hypothetical protein HELRODRAFT_180354 [Helobdella robusta]|uniref:Uncharacterized protein n=1 Tax=Helobdella robusta TaxID=6412 RepID=T1FFT2_HELRO|nr:hypothetical protein HELRODRAFT_180354 [Helobdella robusta]ESN93945.1 hypothetical protein HELRODRAFT_180354 [Helobdella robusta]